MGHQHKDNSILICNLWFPPQFTDFNIDFIGLLDRSNLICQGYNTVGQSDSDRVCDALANLKQAWNRGVLTPITLSKFVFPNEILWNRVQIDINRIFFSSYNPIVLSSLLWIKWLKIWSNFQIFKFFSNWYVNFNFFFNLFLFFKIYVFSIAADITDCTYKEETQGYDLVILFTANKSVLLEIEI